MSQALKHLREMANMTQPELAAKADVPVGSLRNWEQGRRLPRIDAATHLARALGVSLEEYSAAALANQSSADE